MTARYIETHEGFGILFEAQEEDVSMRRHFIKECGWTEAEYRKVKDCEWFCAKVSAHLDGEELGSAYLGCCAYETVEEFYTKYRDDYYKQMRDEAVKEAKQRLAKRPVTAS